MRVLHVYKSYYPDNFGGIEQVIFQLARGLTALGAESRIVTLSPRASPAVLHRPEGEVIRFKTTAQIASNPVSFSALRGYREQAEWADVVHYQFPWPFADVLHLLRSDDTPSVVTYQSDIVRQKNWLRAYRPLMRRFLGSMDAVVATSPNYLATSPVLRELRRKVEVIPNGIDETALPALDPRIVAQWRERVGQGFFLFVGVLRYYKGIHILLQAARQVGKTVVIAGAGPEMVALQSLAGKLGLTHVHFAGEVSERDKVALYSLADVFVFPSNLRSEAFGMSLAEAAMFGRPMISCEIGTGTSFINVDGVTGWTVPSDDPQALAAAMQRFGHDPASITRMGAAARERFQALFTGNRMAKAYMEIYQRLAGRTASPADTVRQNAAPA